MKKKILAVVLAVMLGSTLMTAGVAAEEEPVTLEEDALLKLGGASNTGTMYFVAAAIQEGVSKNFTNLNVMAEATSGGTENIRRLSSGELELAVSSTLAIHEEVAGGTASAENIAFLGSLYPNPYMVFANTSTEPTLEAAYEKGKTIGAGEPGSSTSAQLNLALQVLGTTLDDYNVEYINMGDQTTEMVDGRLDTGFWGGPIPTAAITQLAAQMKGGVHLINWTQEQVDKWIELDPLCSGMVIPANTYDGTDYEVLTPGTYTTLTCRADASEEAIYELTKYIYTHAEELGEIYPTAGQISTDFALEGQAVLEENDGVILHPGAEKFYKEIGLL